MTYMSVCSCDFNWNTILFSLPDKDKNIFFCNKVKRVHVRCVIDDLSVYFIISAQSE